MTEPIHKGKDLPPVWVVHAASGGDSEAMEQVLRYYDDYMSRLCIRTIASSHSDSLYLTAGPKPGLIILFIAERFPPPIPAKKQ